MNTIANQNTIQLGGQSVAYTVRRTKTGKRLRIQVNPKGVEVILPRQAAESQAASFLHENAGWVLEQMAFVERMQPLRVAPSSPEDRTILLRGIPSRVEIVHEPSRRSYGWVEAMPGVLHLHIPANSKVDPNRALETWLRRQARQYIEARLAVRSAEMGQQPKRIYIMNQRTKWGACSTKGNLTFNWRLILAPPEVLDYIVVHELAHLIELNHSAKFWLIVRSYCPEFERHKGYLKGFAGSENQLFQKNH